MSSLRKLSAVYLVAASAWTIAILLDRNPETAAWLKTNGQDAAVAVNDHVLAPSWDFTKSEYRDAVAAIGGMIDPQKPPVDVAHAPQKPAPKIARAEPKPVKPAPAKKMDKTIAQSTPPLRPQVVEPAPKAPETKPAQIAEARPAFSLAPDAKAAKLPDLGVPAPEPPNLKPPSAGELARVSERLHDSLTPELFEHFGLFLYVSKAQAGPLAQRMYVYAKQGNGDLKLLYNWPVSTGREKVEYNPAGRKLPSFTPQGYYELDPDRMYRRYRSVQWNQPMPNAMFFNWINQGNETGLAIHAAHGDDVGLLGMRASAGCVRLSPENASLLYNLIRSEYRGLMPKFAFDRRTATMSNQGVLLHDSDGKVQLVEGYKVLVFIEDFGGENVVAALF